ncbi:bifunctional diguanylate cyclase/phosphodiesterase [Pseudorhodoferax sp. Leaf267]|uniref:GGDEF domain-containing phosphodiesterase n=1 Tax=Pseudorhodoferax sp. Leaf267 TaxID=1736316 RepID=UPI00191073C6|nr:bifunctional diguanylate cyclase/phosphodiesterase [Pseudorhodoferax sp. Leaf267]
MTELPFLLLQAAAIVGMVSVLLLVKRDVPLDDVRYKVRFGLVFGVSGFVLAMLVSEFIKMPSKPYLRTDMLFLAGLLGGWRGGLISLAFATAARLYLGSHALFFAAMIDLVAATASGMVLHGWLMRRPLTQLGWHELLVCFAVRTVVSFTVVSLVYAAGLMGALLYWSNMARRLAGISVAVPMVGAIFMLLRSDAQTREQARKREQAAVTDTLTGLPNRRALRDYIEAEPPRAPAGTRTIVLFEVVNMAALVSVHGDDWSDGFWQQLARDLGSGPSGDVLAGFSPCTFLFSDTTLAMVVHRTSAQELEASGTMAQLHARLTALFQERASDEQPIPQLRIGAVTLDAHPARSVASSLRNISLALQGSENPVQVFPQSFAEKAKSDERLRRMLVEWIRHGTPPLHYQPKFALRNLRTVGAEALLRVSDEQGQPLPPPYVLEIAERHRLLVGLEWATLQAVVRDLEQVGRAMPRLGLAVNISAASFVTDGFAQRVLQLLRSTGVAPSRLTVELTETAKLPLIEIVQHNVQALHQAGVKLSLDDFGTGYAALALLARFPFSEVKIDRWMTTGIAHGRIRQAVVLAGETARRYGAALVTEGVETEWQRQALLELGVTTGQGHLFSHAVPLAELLALRAPQPRTEPAVL